jgi:hypothetical protein
VQGAIIKNASSDHNQHSFAQAFSKTHHPLKKSNNTRPVLNIYTTTKSTTIHVYLKYCVFSARKT